MGKVLAIIGSPRKQGNSYQVTRRLEEKMLALGSSISCSNEIVSKTASVFLQQGALLIQLHRSPYPSFIPNCNH